MRIYTRGGDKGKTALAGGERRFKNDVRIEAYGSVDEAGAFLGLAASMLDAVRDADMLEVLSEIQQNLWNIGADLATPKIAEGRHKTTATSAADMEPLIDRFQVEAETIKHFILRGGTSASATLHVACTVVRRAERRVVELMNVEEVDQPILMYLNRLSDLLFVMARAANAREHRADIAYRDSPEVFRFDKE